jgi:hypothetical protein
MTLQYLKNFGQTKIMEWKKNWIVGKVSMRSMMAKISLMVRSYMMF